jgi:hypothetical protein
MTQPVRIISQTVRITMLIPIIATSTFVTVPSLPNLTPDGIGYRRTVSVGVGHTHRDRTAFAMPSPKQNTAADQFIQRDGS